MCSGASLAVATRHVFEASALHECYPLRRLACILQRLAAQERTPLPVLHAVLPQELQIESLLVGVELLVLLVGHNAVHLCLSLIMSVCDWKFV